MTGDMVLVLLICVAALALFVSNKVRVDVVGLMIMSALILTGLVTVEEGISGFANEATLTVAAMFVVSAGLVRTGGIDMLGRWIAKLAGASELRLIAATLLIATATSAFINNTPVVVVMLPVVLAVARKIGVSPSRVFMPLSFASQLGGTITLIGTSTNLLVAGLLVKLGFPRLEIFEFAAPAAVLAIIGIAYMLTIGRWLMPSRTVSHDLVAGYELRDYLSALIVEPSSPLIGRSLGESSFASRFGLQVVGIERGDERVSPAGATTVLEAGDVLLVRGKIRDLAAVRDVAHLTLATPRHAFSDGEAGNEGTRLAEMMIPPRSPLVGHTLRSSAFRARYGVPVLGIQRHGIPLQEHLRELVLEPGDILLVQGKTEQFAQLHESRKLALIGAVEIPEKRRQKLPIAVVVILAIILLAAFNILPIMTGALLGVVVLFVTGCVTPDEAYKEVDLMVVVLLGSTIPLGIAMQSTGAAAWLAGGLLELTRPLGAHGILFSLYLLTSVLTSVISNNAAALVLVPIAVATATSAGISPMPLVIGVMFAASNDFATPIGYQTNTFIYGPGGYKFGDFLRVGGLLNVILIFAATWIIPVFFPF